MSVLNKCRRTNKGAMLWEHLQVGRKFFPRNAMNSAAGVVVLPPLRPISIREFRIQCMEHWVCSRNLNRNWFVRLEYDNNVLSKVAGHTVHSECSISTESHLILEYRTLWEVIYDHLPLHLQTNIVWSSPSLSVYSLNIERLAPLMNSVWALQTLLTTSRKLVHELLPSA